MTAKLEKKQPIIISLNILFFLFIFFYPNNGTYYFDGLPFTNTLETLLFTIFFPLSLFFNFILKSRKILFFLIIIFIFKIFLIYAPQVGVNVKQYFTINQKIENNYIRTFDSFWNKEVSILQKFPWKKQNNFPLDWTHLSKINIKNETNSDDNKLYINNYEDFENLLMFYDYNFYLNVKKEKEFHFNSGNSSKLINQKIKKFDEKTNKFKIKDLKLDSSNRIILSKGIYNFNLSFEYLGTDWKFDPYTIKNSNNLSLFEERSIYSDLNNFDLDNLSLKIFLGKIYEILIFVLLILVIIEIYIHKLKKEKESIFFGVLFFVSYLLFDIVIDKLFSIFNIIDGVGSFSFGFANLVFVSFITYFIYINKKLKDYSSIFIFTSVITCLYVFANIFSFDLQTFSWAGKGDDWTTFQEYSRQIVVQGEWIKAGESVFYFRPGSRYIYALSHIIFGQSAFAYKMLNVWSIILCSYLIIKILIKLDCNIFLSYMAGIILISIYTADNFRWLLIVGLSEYYAMICLIISIYLIIKKEHLSTVRFLLIVFLGIIQIWLREEHVPVVLSLILLMNYNYKFADKGNFKFDFIKCLYLYLKKNGYLILFYSSLIILGFASIFIRNYFVGGKIGIFDIHAVKTLVRSEPILTTYYHVFSRLILGVDQYYPTLPKIYSIFNISAIIISLITIFNFRKFSFVIFGLPLTLIAIILPYFFVENIAYTPRYTIHLLPVSIIICFVFLNEYLKRYNEKNTYNRI